MTKIITIGEIVVEIMALEPGSGFREPVPLLGPFPSGAPAIFIDQVARLGQPCGIVSCVGDDEFGHLNIERLRRDGVDVSAVAMLSDAVTGSAFVRYRPDGQRDFVFNIRHSACGAIDLAAEAEALIEEAGHVHVMGSSLFASGVVAAICAAVSRIKANGGTVSFDPNIRKEMLGLPGLKDALEYIFSRTDLFLPSGSELFLFTGQASESAVLREILARGVKAIVVKRGAAGASYHDPFNEFRVPGHPVEEVDPTGAGDIFDATFVTCWVNRMDPSEALRRANASGALAVQRRGPMEGTSTHAELDHLLVKDPAEPPI